MEFPVDVAGLFRENPNLLKNALSLLSSGAASAPREQAEAARQEGGKTSREALFAGIRPYLCEKSLKKLDAALVLVMALERFGVLEEKGGSARVSSPD